MSDEHGAILGLGLSADDISLEDTFKLIVRRLAQQEKQLTRIANALELQLKLGLIKENLSLSALKSAEYDMTPAVESEKPAMEMLSQTPDEIEMLDRTYETLVERMGKGNVPLDLDLYAEAAKLEPDNPEEAP